MKKNEMSAKLDEIRSLTERIEAALVVRDPGSARSAEAFEGLRKQVAAASRSRRVHLSHLVTLATDIEKGANLETVSRRVDDLLRESGVDRTRDTSIAGAFEFDGEGDDVVVQEHAWVDVLEDGSAIVLRQGRALRRPTGGSVTEPLVDMGTVGSEEQEEAS